MTPYRQLIRHEPETGLFGDCHRTALASLLDMPPADVPHVFDRGQSAEEGYRALDKWLASRGLATFTMALTVEVDVVLAAMSNHNPGIYYLLSGRGPRGIDHTVVACGDKIVSDPAAHEDLQRAIVGPDSNGHVWITLLVPLSQAGGA